MCLRLLIAILCALCALIGLSHASAQDQKQPAPQPSRSVSALWSDLAKPVSVAPFQEAMTLAEAFKALNQEYRTRYGKELPLTVVEQPFKLENPDAPELMQVGVRLPAVPRQRSAAQVLRALIAQIPTDNATLFIKPGVIEITTKREVLPETLLQRTVDLRFERQPLSFVLEQIYEQTGVYVALDPRVGIRARTPISLRFTNDLRLGAGLLLITEMADLKLVVGDNVVVVTTPLAAQGYWQEQMRHQTWLQQATRWEP